MKNRTIATVLIATGVLGIYLSVQATDDCPDDVDDCIYVTGKRIICEDGAMCSDGLPEHLAVDCYLDLVGDPEAYVSGAYGEERGNVHIGV